MEKWAAPATTAAAKGDIDFENELFVQSLKFLQAHGGDKNDNSLWKARC